MPQGFPRVAAPGAFFDTDFSTVDSLLAVSLLYDLQGKNDCRVAIITMSARKVSPARHRRRSRSLIERRSPMGLRYIRTM